jgi:poly-gamma-glutamate capsule biosynthesis protein CapA/YwtB (metallophosphatase superfamily)
MLRVRTAAFVLATSSALAPSASGLAQDLDAGAPGPDVHNAKCAENEDALSNVINYVLGVLKQDESNPAGVTPIPKKQVFVSEGQRAGLIQKRIVMFGDMFGMKGDTPAYMSDDLRNIFKNADMVLNNIEAPITWNNGELDLNGGQLFDFHENVAYIKSAMAQMCIDPAKAVFTVANNHAGDPLFAPTSLWGSTLENAAKTGATIVGIDNNVSREPEVTVKDLGNGVRVGIVAWTHLQNRAPETAPVGSPNVDAAGIKYPTWEASRRVFEQGPAYWAQKKKDLDLDMLIGVPHWDCQYKWYPRPETVRWADELHQNGFDLIAGGHTSLMPAKVHNPGTDNDMTFYSLGAINNGIDVLDNWFVSVVELVVDQNGRTLEYTVHPFVQHKVDPTFNWLRATPLCGTKLYFDRTRQSNWKVVPLDALRNSPVKADRDFYTAKKDRFDKMFR